MSTIGTWLWRHLGGNEPDRPDADHEDPEVIVEAGYVDLWCAGIVASELGEEGITATFAEERAGPFVGVPKARIFCAGRDLDAARRVVAMVLESPHDGS